MIKRFLKLIGVLSGGFAVVLIIVTPVNALVISPIIYISPVKTLLVMLTSTVSMRTILKKRSTKKKS